MAETRWTDEQLSAINTRDRTLLVSAAAGSGKTATLTERIIRSLTDKDSPMDIDSILVVTFTNAAASELRAKISRALSVAVEADPDNKHLRRQLHLLPSAKIRTIDSFCNEILRANCDRVGLSPGYRIADTAEIELLAISILEGLIEAVYNGELCDVATPADFEALADCLTDSGRTEELAEVFRYIHLRCESAEEGIALLRRLTENYNRPNTPTEETVYGSYLMEQYRGMLTHYIECADKYIADFKGGGVGEEKYLAMVTEDRELLSGLLLKKSYSEAREAILEYSFTRMPSVRKDRTERMDSYKVLRDDMKADLSRMKEHFLYTDGQWAELFASLYRLLSVLCAFEECFDRLFTEEKRRRGALSYADIERYTYNCLIENGRPTDVAKNIAAGFEAIYIDEYQDVNSLQNRIFEAISRPDNRFMVGDIKQSIYGFRSARPEIFASMKAAFPPLSEIKGDNASIFMSSNFRCDRGVVDFVNRIFDSAFGLTGESIGYMEGDKLGYAKIHTDGEPEYSYPTVCMVAKDDSEEKNPSARVVAAKISELLKNGRLDDGSAVRPSDIAIILRNARGRDGEYASALEEMGIPTCITGAKDFFLSPEVLLALCLLNSIDNPRRDIYLAGLMCSPLFDFSADELMLIRRAGGDSLYTSLVKYLEADPGYTKGASFLNTLEYYRTIAEGVGVDTLINKLYRETGLMSLASRSGGKENLTLLYDYARSYESGSFKGLYSFISFINNIIDKKTTFDDARARAGVDAVRIVTAHASKGLEYPIVFMVEADGRIYNKDRNSRLAFSEDFGISFRLRTPSGLAVVNNPVQDIINHYITAKLYEEELRVLYVALTRARERLFVVGKCPISNPDEYLYRISVLRENLSEYTVRSLDSYQDIILVCEGATPLSAEQLCGEIAKGGEVRSDAVASENKKIDRSLTHSLRERFGFEYKDLPLTVLPEKMSVSLMSPTVLDGSEEDDLSLFYSMTGQSDSANISDSTLGSTLNPTSGLSNDPTLGSANDSTPEDKRSNATSTFAVEDSVVKYTDADDEDRPRRILPSFATGSRADESAKRGIATHLFMQFCDLENLYKNGGEEELRSLCDRGFIGKEDSERVRLYEIEMFRRSELLSRMRGAKQVYRELRFNVYLPAASFTADPEKQIAYKDKDILVQGVIDCIILDESGNITLCDYKTDRLTREELADRSLAEGKLRDKHSMQLGLYSMAVERIFGKRPDRVEIYSLPLGDTVSII